MKKLFEPAMVGGLPLRNRCIRSATFEYAYDNDRETAVAKLLPLYETLARHGVAAIISGMVGVDARSRAAPVMGKAYGPTFAPEWARLAERVRGLGSRLIVQINHCGQKAGQIDDGGFPLGPSDTENAGGFR